MKSYDNNSRNYYKDENNIHGNNNIDTNNDNDKNDVDYGIDNYHNYDKIMVITT